MFEKKRYNFKKILAAIVWMLFGAGLMVLLGAAMYKKDNSRCRSVEITIAGFNDNFFIDKADVYAILERMKLGNPLAKPLNTFDLAGMEAVLEKNIWIRSAELYFDNNDVLKINITEREPVVRIFSAGGSSFYIDSATKKLPLNTKFSPRLPVFTNFPGIQRSFSKADSALLRDIKDIGIYIMNDAFWMAQIEQVDITPGRSFEMIPKIGNQVIIFGTADNYREKFNTLLLFYKKVQSKVGWNKYASINVSYREQVIAVKRGEGDIKADSLRTIQLIKQLMANAQKQANESINTIQLVQPRESNTIPFAQSGDESFPDEQASYSDTLTPSGTKSVQPEASKPHMNTNELVKPALQHTSGADQSGPGKRTPEKPVPEKKEAQGKTAKPPENDY